MQGQKLKFIQKTFVVIVSTAVLLMPIATFAATESQLKAQQDYYKQQAAAAAAAKAAKAAQAAQIAQDINYLDSQISETESAINATTAQISATQNTIAELESGIKTEEEKLAMEQDKMSSIISSWYMQGKSGFLEAVIGSSNISEVVDQQQYYDSVRGQLQNEIDKINQMKADLNQQKSDQTSQLVTLSDLQKSQEGQKNYLGERQTIKGQLYSNTQSAISSLTTEQANANKMVADLQAKIDSIRAASIGAGGDVVSSGAESWYLQQTDSRWASDKMGYWATIGTYGCLLTSLSMVANFYGASYTPATAAQNSSFVHGGSGDGALISTSIVSDGKSQSINWSTVDDELANNHPVIVGVALGIDMGNSYGVSHFVVLTSKMGDGKYAMQDPLGQGRGYRKSQVKAMRIIRP